MERRHESNKELCNWKEKRRVVARRSHHLWEVFVRTMFRELEKSGRYCVGKSRSRKLVY